MSPGVGILISYMLGLHKGTLDIPQIVSRKALYYVSYNILPVTKTVTTTLFIDTATMMLGP